MARRKKNKIDKNIKQIARGFAVAKKWMSEDNTTQ